MKKRNASPRKGRQSALHALISENTNSTGSSVITAAQFVNAQSQQRPEASKKSVRTLKVQSGRRSSLKEKLFPLYLKNNISLTCVPEFRFDDTRRWRFDYAIPEHRIAVEVEGGIWTNGRHTRGKGYMNDMEKYNRATVLGWRLIRVAPDRLFTTYTLQLIKDILYDQERAGGDC